MGIKKHGDHFEEEDEPHCSECGEKCDECRCVDYPDDSGEE